MVFSEVIAQVGEQEELLDGLGDEIDTADEVYLYAETLVRLDK